MLMQHGFCCYGVVFTSLLVTKSCETRNPSREEQNFSCQSNQAQMLIETTFLIIFGGFKLAVITDFWANLLDVTPQLA